MISNADLTAQAIAAPVTARTEFAFAAKDDRIAIVRGVEFEAARVEAARRLGVPQSTLTLRSRRS